MSLKTWDKWTEGEIYNDDFKKVIPLTMTADVALVPENVTVKKLRTFDG